MRQLNYDYSNYDHKEELKVLVNSINESFDKFAKSFDGRKSSITRLEASIEKKKTCLEKAHGISESLKNRISELSSLKSITNDEIRELDEKKKSISYEDSEVQKMETEDLDVIIEAKQSKISKITERINATTLEAKTKDTDIKRIEGEIKSLENEKKMREESQLRTDALIELINNTRNNFSSGVEEILRKKIENSNNNEDKKENVKIELAEEPKKVTGTLKYEPVMEDLEITGDKDVNPKLEEDYDIVDYELSSLDEKPIEEETEIISIVDNNDSDNMISTSEKQDNDETSVIITEPEDISDTEELSILDFDKIELPEDALPVQRVEAPTEEKDYKQVVEDTFKKEGINYEDFPEEAQIKLVENADRVLKNIIVLKKHMIPLELTTQQSGIYYNIEPQDLDDLLDIITNGEDGNGMGFTIDYTFYILEELSKVNIDNLISTYNNEFMNINSKSGVINLLKLTDSNLGEFEINKKANTDVLKSLGVTTSDLIAENYPEFINMDNPLFLNALNLFDKDDLVEKLNSDIKIVPKIIDYWKAN